MTLVIRLEQEMQQASNVLLSPIDLSASYVVRVYELTLVDPTYHFSTYEISTDRKNISFSKTFPPDFKGYPCGTMLREKIRLNADPNELCILDAEINGDEAIVCVLARREEDKEYNNEPICMNVS